MEKEGSEEDLIRKIVCEDVKALVQESVKQALGKRKGIDEEELYSLSEDKDRLRGPGGKCLNKRRHLMKDQGKIGVLSGSKKKGTLSGAMESQLDAEKECFSGDFMNEEDDEYLLDLEYKGELEDKLAINCRTSSSEELLDPLGEKLFEPKDIRHPRGKEWWTMEHVASYNKDRRRKPLEKDERNIMSAQCSRSVIDNKVCLTPNLDPEMLTYLFI
ncbi:hypothetical protein NDU88_004662 [Pleurodeles waltl]|uniref:Uncharacterized protein n=1 Tax=Pleurodeles waltl TaxID=8319 RepID=A0AAV7VIW3_PLEWA|nr:hypothetical protein NDU88_004662 [Pleurodeles waltl]